MIIKYGFIDIFDNIEKLREFERHFIFVLIEFRVLCLKKKRLCKIGVHASSYIMKQLEFRIFIFLNVYIIKNQLNIVLI